MRKRIGVLGYYGKDNIGDESYKLSFPILFPKYDFVFSDSPLPDCDGYVLGGGDVVSPSNLALLRPLQKPKFVLSATCVNRVPLHDFKLVAVRDDESMAVARDSGANPMLSPDFAFALAFNRKRGRKIIEDLYKGSQLYQRVVIVVGNGHLIPSHGDPSVKMFEYEHFLLSLAKLADNTNASFLFLPFGLMPPTYDDRVIGGVVASKCKFWPKNKVVYDKLSVQDTLDIISAADAVVSSRLHSSIFACLSSTPFIDITHNHKNRAFLASVGLSKLSRSYNGFGYDELCRFLADVLARTSSYQDELTVVCKRERQRLERFASNVTLL